MDNCCCGRQNSSWASPKAVRGKWKAVRGKCERRRGSANADGAGAEVFAGDGCSQGRLSAPWLRFHGVDRADVYIIIIRVRACCCGECALNPPTSPPIPRRRPSLAPAQRHALPSTSAPPRSPDACPQAARCLPRRPHNTFPAEDLRSPPHSDTPSPNTSARPRSPDAPSPSTSAPPRSANARPPTARCIPRRPHNTFPAEDLLPPPHNDTPFPHTSTPPPRPDAHPQAARCIPRRPHHTFPAESLLPPPHGDTPFPSTFSLPPRADTHPQAARCTPAGCAMHSPPTAQPIPAAPRCLPFRSASGTKKRHRTVDVRCRMSRSTVVAVGHWGW